MNILKMIGVDFIKNMLSNRHQDKSLSSHAIGENTILLMHEVETYHAELHAQNIELRESQLQLLQSKDRFQALYDFAPVGFATFSPKGCMVDLNLTLAGYLNCDRDLVRNIPFVCWLGRDQSLIFIRHLNRAFSTQEKQTVELQLKEINGYTRAIRLETIPKVEASGKILFCKSAIIDITYEKKVEAELKQSHKNLELQVEKRTHELNTALQELTTQITERRTTQRIAEESEGKYRLLFSCVSEAIIFYDAETRRIIDANQSAVDLYGYSVSEFKALLIQDLCFSAGSQPTKIDDGNGYSHELSPPIICHRGRNGEKLPVELSTGSFVLNAREVVFVIIHNMQERLAAEARLKLAANVFECANEAIMVADSDFRIVMVNQAFTKISGYESEDVMGRDSRMLLTPYPDFESLNKLKKNGNDRYQFQQEVVHRHKCGAEYHAWENLSAVRNSDGTVAYYIHIFSDISQLKEAEAQSSYLAHHDSLTHLPNRLLFSARLEQSLQLAKRSETNLALLFLDLDRFKYINDTMGHASGDRLLKEIAKRIESSVREQDTVARFGGDEFTVLLSALHQEQDAAALAEKILQAVAKPVTIDENEIVVSTSIGISLFPRDGNNAQDLLKAADVAMYHAKERGRHKFEFYTRELTARSEERLQMEHNIRDNLSTGNFFLYYQPQFDLMSGRVTGVEALLRWRHADGSISTPEKIIAIAEESSLILDVDAWVLRTACEQAAYWHRAGARHFKVAINFSAMNLMRDDFATKVKKILEELSLPPDWIELEVTESVLQSGPNVIAELESLKNLGITLAIDDFGTGYSSLSALKTLPIDRIKIDKSFITDVPSSQSDAGITQAIITMGHNLNLKVIAEGVENDSQWRFLQSIGCDEVQGFRFGKPEKASIVPSYLDMIISLQSPERFGLGKPTIAH